MIVLTGVTGLLGKYIALKLLKHGYNLACIVRNTQDSFVKSLVENYPGRIQVVQADVLDVVGMQAAFQGEVEAVIHSAAVVSFWKKDYPQMMRVNVEGTANVVNLCLAHKVPKLIYVSSVAALGREDFRNRNEFITENSKWKDSPLNTYYGYTKHLAEKEVLRGVEEGLPAVICNPVMIIGYAGRGQSSGALFEQVYNGIPVYPTGRNGFVSAEDVAAAIFVLLLGNIDKGERFILVAENLSYAEVFQQIAQAIAKPAPRMPLTPALGRVFGWASETLAGITGKQPAVTTENARYLSTYFQYSNALFKSAFVGFEFSPIKDAIQVVGKEFVAFKTQK